MGIERMHSPKYWRDRAEEFRTKADACENAGTRASLRKVAANYEELARRAQQIVSLADLDRQDRKAVLQDYVDDQRAVIRDLSHKLH